MPLFAIRRSVPGATQTDIDAAAFRAINCMPWHEGMTWVRSFYNAQAEELLCYYEAADADEIRLHAQRAAIPCDEIVEVEEIDPQRYIHA